MRAAAGGCLPAPLPPAPGATTLPPATSPAPGALDAPGVLMALSSCRSSDPAVSLERCLLPSDMAWALLE